MKEILTLLLRIEWQGSEVHYMCPSCRASRMHGHMSDCVLKAKIDALSQEPEKVA